MKPAAYINNRFKDTDKLRAGVPTFTYQEVIQLMEHYIATHGSTRLKYRTTWSRPGRLVEVKGRGLGRTYNEEPLHYGKYKVYLMDKDFQLTGEKLLVRPAELNFKGYLD